MARPASCRAALRTNLRAWDTTVRAQRREPEDEAARLARGELPPDLEALDGEFLRATGPLDGLDVLHLLCNRGPVSVALARTARSVLGVDFSAEAVAAARALARAAGSPARFREAEALRFLAMTRCRFDAVVAAWGVMVWIPDLRAFARGIARVLRPGGFAYVLDGHPMANTGVGIGAPGDTYFAAPGHGEPRRPAPGRGEDDGRDSRSAGAGRTSSGAGASVREDAAHDGPACGETPPRRERWTFDYDAPGRGREVGIAWWQWPLGDVVTAFAEAGLAVESLREFAGTHPSYYGSVVPLDVEGTTGFLPGRRGVLPLSFGLRVRKGS